MAIPIYEEVDRLRAVNKELLEACKRGRNALLIAIDAAWEYPTEKDAANHPVIVRMDAAIAKAKEFGR